MRERKKNLLVPVSWNRLWLNFVEYIKALHMCTHTHMLHMQLSCISTVSEHVNSLYLILCICMAVVSFYISLDSNNNNNSNESVMPRYLVYGDVWSWSAITVTRFHGHELVNGLVWLGSPRSLALLYLPYLVIVVIVLTSCVYTLSIYQESFSLFYPWPVI